MLGDPMQGTQRHHKKNAVLVPSYSEALELVRKGHSIRMSDGRASASLVAPGSLEFVDEPVARIDDLWTYTMPEPPFPFDAVLDDLRAHFQSQASDLSWIANDNAATAFIGFPFDSGDDSESGEVRARIDLDRFNLTRIARTAYESTFRPWSSNEISEEDVDELEQIIAGSLTRYPRRHASPLDRSNSPLFRTLMAAYFRWQISDGCFLDRERLDQDAVRAIGVLTGMPDTTIRTALSRDGISTVKSRIDYPALVDWIITRRNFAPLRESERREAQWAWRVADELHKVPLPQAFAAIRERMHVSTPELLAAEQAISARIAAGHQPTDAEARQYATVLGVSPDSFIVAIREIPIAN